MSYDFSIGPIVGMLLKPKYQAINTFLGEDFDASKGFDVFIDLNCIVTALSTSSKFLNSLPFAKDNWVEKDIIANVLSALKHWKDYTRRMDDSRIFVIVNSFEMGLLPERNMLKSYLVPYVNKFDQERFAQMNYYWTEAMKKIKIILKYIPKIYFVECNKFDSYVIPNIVDDYKNNNRNRFIVTSNYMMTTYIFEKDCKVRLTKFKHQMVDPLMIARSISGIDDDIMQTFVSNKVFYELLIAVIGDFDRGLIGISQFGISSFANDLLRAIERNEVPKDPKSIESILPVINETFHSYLRTAYPLIDIQSHSDMIPNSSIEKMKSELIDLYDIDGLRQISVADFNLLDLL